MTQIKHDTEKVHLVGDDGRAICGVEYAESTVELASWKAGFTPASVGTRICRDCEEKTGLGARFEPDEEDRMPSTWRPLDRPGGQRGTETE